MESRYTKLIEAILIVLSIYYLLVYFIRKSKAGKNNVQIVNQTPPDINGKIEPAKQPAVAQEVIKNNVRNEKFSFLGSSYVPVPYKIDTHILNSGTNIAPLNHVEEKEKVNDTSTSTGVPDIVANTYVVENATNKDESILTETIDEQESSYTKGRRIITSPSEIFNYVDDEQPVEEKPEAESEVPAPIEYEHIGPIELNQPDPNSGILDEAQVYESELDHELGYEPVIVEKQPDKETVLNNEQLHKSSSILENLSKIKQRNEIDDSQEDADFSKLMAAKNSILKAGNEIKQKGIVYDSEKRESIVNQLLLVDEGAHANETSIPDNNDGAHELKQDKKRRSSKGSGKKKETAQRKNRFINIEEILLPQKNQNKV